MYLFMQLCEIQRPLYFIAVGISIKNFSANPFLVDMTLAMSLHCKLIPFSATEEEGREEGID